MKTIRENIRNFRQFRNMTQVELGKALGRSKNVVSNWERGDNEPDLDTIAEICRVLNVTPNQMFGWEKNPEYEDRMARLTKYAEKMTELERKKEEIERAPGAEISKYRINAIFPVPRGIFRGIKKDPRGYPARVLLYVAQ